MLWQFLLTTKRGWDDHPPLPLISLMMSMTQVSSSKVHPYLDIYGWMKTAAKVLTEKPSKLKHCRNEVREISNLWWTILYCCLSKDSYLSKEQSYEHLEKPTWRAISIPTTKKKGGRKPSSLQACNPKESLIKINQKEIYE